MLDFSGSILEDQAVRADFADAIDGIANRVDQITDRLVAGDATVSIVRFATRAADLPNCTNLRLRENRVAVAALADCLRNVARTYRTGGDAALTNAIGDDTNYVAAMDEAAGHLPAGSLRPAIIFFTDGRHEAAGVPVTDVLPARDRLFGDRSPFALLPVGMGVDPDDRTSLEAGLAQLRLTRDFERCDGGALSWPNVVFESAESAGQAVGVALQDVSCTFTVEPTPAPSTPAPSASAEPTEPPPPTPSPTPLGPPPPPTKPSVDAFDAGARVAVAMPSDARVTGVRFECSSDGGATWTIEREVQATTTQITGLANGTSYVCRAFASNASGLSGVSPVSDVFRPCGGVADCNPFILPVFGVLVALLLAVLLFALWRWYGGRKVYVTVQVDRFGSIHLGRGPRVGMAFVRSGPYRRVMDVAPAEGRDADVRIRYAGGEKFDIKAAKSRVKTTAGRLVEITDAEGQPHSLVVYAYDHPPMSDRPGDADDA